MSDNRALRLLEAFSGVEEDLLERCESAAVQGKAISFADKLTKKLKKNSWRYGSAAAAVFCLILVGAASLNGLRMTANDSAVYEAVTEGMSGGAAAPENENAGEGDMQTTASAPTSYYVVTENAEADGFIGQVDGGTNNGSVGNSGATNGMISGSTEEKSAATESADDITAPVQEALKSEKDTAEGCKEFAYVVVSEAESRAHETFGAYVPTKLPEGYVLEGAYVSEEGEIPALMLSWSRGMDSIMVNITLPEERPVTVDVEKTEAYDEYLYEIPHAETVPEDYREIFNNPVCAWEEFSLEFVQKRMIAREDAGDTDTPRGNFSVLYPDGVLVYFNGRGTAEEIWAMFGSMDATN